MKSQLLLLITLALCSCSKAPEENPLDKIPDENKKVVTRRTREIGKVISVNEDEQFVLIRIVRANDAREFQNYYIEAGERRATLTPTEESIGSLSAADIISGTPKQGDRVLVIPNFGSKKKESLTPLSEPAPVVEKPATEEPESEKLSDKDALKEIVPTLATPPKLEF